MRKIVFTPLSRVFITQLFLIFSFLGLKAQTYCNSNFTSVSFEHITNVTFAGINNSSAGTVGGPVNYTAQVATVNVGVPSTLSVTILADASEYVYAFIDWNQDGDFVDADEVYTVASSVSTAGPHSVQITPPNSATPGSTRMRIMLDFGGSVPNSCKSGTYGEAEDYTVNVVTSPCVAPPTAGNASSSKINACSGENFNLSLTGNSLGSGQTYKWQYSLTGNAPWTDVDTAKLSPVYTISQTTSTYYRCAVTCTGNTVYSDSVQVVTPALIAGGTYTINGALPTGGGNFATFAEAIDYIKCGISAPVVFNVATGSGPYTITTPLSLPKINGTSATNTITFNGNGESIIYNTSDANNRTAIVLNGADNIIIDSFTVDVSGGTYGWGIQLTNSADSNIIRKCTILTSTTATTTNYAGIVVSGSITGPTTAGENGNGNLFEKNRIVGGYYGFTICGTTTSLDSNNIIKDNKFEDYYYYGIYSIYEHSLNIEGNDFSRPTRTNFGAGYSIYSATGNINTKIDKNRIHNLFTAAPTSTTTHYAIYITSDGTAALPNLITNNLIYNIEGDGTHYGIYNSGAAYAKMYHNTIAFDYIGATAGITYGFYQVTSDNGIEFKNNIVYITRGGSGVKYCIYKSTPSTAIASNKNVFFLGSAGSGTQSIGYQTSAQSDLTAWQTATSQDMNSMVADPLFTNPSGGDYLQTEPTIDDIGAAVGVAKDINGVNRSATTPDPGAYEKPASVGIDMKPVTMVSPLVSVAGCYNTETITVRIENNSVDTIFFSTNPVTVAANITGAATATYSAIVNSGFLPPDSLLNVTMATPGATLNMTTVGAYNFDISTSVIGDVNSSNNTISLVRTKVGLTGGTASSTMNEICASTPVPPTVSVTSAEGYNTIRWQQSTTTGSGFTDIPAANAISYTLGTVPLDTMYYRLVATCGTTDVNSTEVMITVVNPQVATTTAGSRCGPGTVNLSATAPGFDIKWYADSTGGAPLYTGGTFTTPFINVTDTFYAAAANNPIPVPPVVVGAGGSTSTSYESPYYYLYGNKLSQYLFKASELTALGMTAGNITSVAFDVVAPNSSYSNFSISFKSTNANDLTTNLESGLYTVYTSATETPVAGINTYSFISTPFIWDGASNIIMQVCWGNNNTGGTGATVKMDATTFVSNSYFRTDGTMSPTFCNTLTATATTLNRPQTTFGFDASCVGLRVPVIATVNTPPSITASVLNDTLCMGQSTTINVTSSNSGYSYTWEPGSLIGSSQVVTPSANTKYVVSAVDNSGGVFNGCTNKDSVTIVVNQVPTVLSPNSTPGTICTTNGDIAKLVANGGTIGGEFSFGTAANQNTATSYPSVYSAYYGGQRMQMLITAAELIAQGMQAGMINSITFPVVSLGTNWGGSITSCQDFQVSIGSTSATSLTAFESGLTQVVAPANYTPVVGYTNEHVFLSPFMWDGVSNLIIETTFSNNFLGGTNDGVITYNTSTSYQSSIVYRADSQTPAAIASGNTISVSASARVDFKLNSATPTTYMWSPLTGLYTDAAATIPYTGTSLDTVYAKPASTTSYSISATTTENCSVNGNVTVTVDCSVPVTYTMFTGKKEGTVNMLSWQTATETNNTGFELQRSADGKEYSKLSFVNSKANNGNSSMALNYAYNDAKPLSGNNYYRLKQIDKDGKANYSNVVILKADKVNQIRIASVYPNPVRNTVNVQLVSPTNERVSLVITDITGKVLLQENTTVVAGDNIKQINVSSLSQGSYLIKVNCANGCESAVVKFVK
jgi:hypothetical protein